MSNNLSALRGPRLTTTQRDALSEKKVGDLIYNTTTARYESWDGSIWWGNSRQSFTELTDTPVAYTEEKELPVINATGTGLTFTTLAELSRVTAVGGQVYQHVMASGATYYFPLHEGVAPFKNIVGETLVYMVATSPTEVSSSQAPSIHAINPIGCTTIVSRTTGWYSCLSTLAAYGEPTTLSVTFEVPASELVSDLINRTLIDFGGNAKIVIRNGQVAYIQGSTTYHPETLAADVPFQIQFTRDALGTITLWVNETALALPSNQLYVAYSNVAVMSATGGTEPLLGSVQGLTLWNRVLTPKELMNISRVCKNLPLVDAYYSSTSFSELTDGVGYVEADANKAVVINATGTGLALKVLNYIPTTQLIEDGLRGYISGAVPSDSVLAMQIQNKNLSISTNVSKSKAYALSAPTAEVVLTIAKAPLGSYATETVIGSITFENGSNTGVLIINELTTFIPGDMLYVKSPAAANGMRDLFLNVTGAGPMPYST
jgi:hypothetical protein